MHRLSSALVQALESTSIAIVSLLATLVPAFLAFTIGQGFAGDPLVPWRIAVDAWLLGHGVDVGVTLGDAAVVRVGLDAAGEPFVLSLAAWGIGFVTILLSMRSGVRLAQTRAAGWGLVGGVAATSLLGVVLAVSAQHAVVAPNIGQAAIGPAACTFAGLVIGMLWRADDPVGRAAEWLAIDERAVALVRGALRAGLGVAAAMVGLGALLLAVTLIARQADVILLFESLQPDHLGVVLLWLVQLALLPVAVIWSTSWMLGSGFTLGTGSSVSPIGTDLGPVPTQPLLGAIVPGVEPWSLVVVALPLLASVGIGALVRQRGVVRNWWEGVVVAVGGGLVAGGVLALLALATVGGIGPGRLAETGPTPWLVGLLAAGIGALGTGVGIAATGRGDVIDTAPIAVDGADVDGDGLGDEGADGDDVDSGGRGSQDRPSRSLPTTALTRAGTAVRGWFGGATHGTGRGSEDRAEAHDDTASGRTTVPGDPDGAPDAQQTGEVDVAASGAVAPAASAPDTDAASFRPLRGADADATATAPVPPLDEADASDDAGRSGR